MRWSGDLRCERSGHSFIPGLGFFLCVLASGVLVAGVARADVQLPYATASDEELGLPADVAALPRRTLPRDIPGRRIPDLTVFPLIGAPDLADRAVPLPEANTLAHLNYQRRRFGRLQSGSGGISFFNPESVLVKFRSQPLAAALRVEPGREWEAVQGLRRRSDVEFAQLDTFERRQFTPNDPLIGMQWHHAVIGSYQAWQYGLGSAAVRLAIVDSPFQMDHPDLAANTVPGWDIVANQPVTTNSGISHSTMCAGMAAAVINNGVGVAGAANCRILPININGAISEMYDATLWAATNGVRVVNISWSGGTNALMESAGYFLKTNAGGILVMSAIDGAGPLDAPNQPDVYCIAETDAADNFQVTMYGPYIDFAAPGYQIFSTTIGGSYATGSGCSFAAPLFAGVVAWIFGINPTLAPGDVIGILTNTTVELGGPGWNQFYGWGRVNFAGAATAAVATLPNIVSTQWSKGQVIIQATFTAGLQYSLCRASQLSSPVWTNVATVLATNGSLISLTDPAPPQTNAFYRVQATSGN
jgi:subtilisin family serine protease